MTTFRAGISPEGFIDIKGVAKKLGVSKTTAWEWVKSCPNFPKKIKVGARTSRWRESEVDAWLEWMIEMAAAEASTY